MKPKRDRSNEVICMCSAYNHPHRLSGGCCDGVAWLVSYRSIDSYCCDNCNHSNGTTCDVVEGLEPFSYSLDCVVDELRTRHLTEEYGYLPLDVEDYLEKQYREYQPNY